MYIDLMHGSHRLTSSKNNVVSAIIVYISFCQIKIFHTQEDPSLILELPNLVIFSIAKKRRENK